MTEEKLQQAEFLQNEIKKLKSLISHLDGDYIQHTNVKLNQPDEILFNYWNGNYQMRVPSEYVKIELPDRREIQKKISTIRKTIRCSMTTRNFENGKVKCLECGKKIVLNETFIVGIDRTGKEYVYCAEHGKKLKKKNVIAA